MAQSCQFCGGGPSTKEHVFGKWLYKSITSPDERKTTKKIQHAITIERSGTPVASEGFLDGRIGSTLGVTTRTVCRRCNNGWMSEIESSMQQAFTALTGCPETPLSRAHSVAAFRWAYLKFALFVRSYDPTGFAGATTAAEE